MTGYDDLQRLASLIRKRNAIEKEVTAIIERPMHIGHIGEFIAARVFGIELHASATHKGSDGYFISGGLEGRSVNIKFYGKNEGILDMKHGDPPDFYLVLTGPRRESASSRGLTRPWMISSVFLFEHHELVSKLTVKNIGIATSVKRHLWDTAEIYPSQNNITLQLTQSQRSAIEMFRDESTPETL